jgi:hypothetical protein
MNLHFAINDRFVHEFIKKTNEIGLLNENLFVIYGDTIVETKVKIDVNVIHINDLNDSLNYINNVIDNVDNIYIHYLSIQVVNLLQNVKLKINVVWVFWGSDGYQLYGVREVPRIRDVGLKEYFRSLKFELFGPRNTEIISFIRNHVKYFAHYIKEDCNIINEKLNVEMEFIDFTYASVSSCLYNCSNEKKNIILVGNSGDTTNNHLVIFKRFLSTSNSEQIVCPLSYGGNAISTQRVINYATEKFGEKFTPLLNKLSYEDYNENILCLVKSALFYHEVPQAYGNILQLLYNGAKVYLNPRSNLYTYLIRLGFKIYPLNNQTKCYQIDQLDIESQGYNRKLTMQVCDNREINRKYNYLLKLHVRN